MATNYDEYSKTGWVDGRTNPISASNLSKIEQGIYDNRENTRDIKNVDIPAINSNISTLYGRDIYSTSEQSVGVWIDGKILYRKTFYFSTNGSASLSGLNIERGFIDFAHSSIDINYSGTQRHVAPVQISTSSSPGPNQSSVYFDNSYAGLYLEKGSGVTSISGYVTINYTKTTDQANS